MQYDAYLEEMSYEINAAYDHVREAYAASALDAHSEAWFDDDPRDTSLPVLTGEFYVLGQASPWEYIPF